MREADPESSTRSIKNIKIKYAPSTFHVLLGILFLLCLFLNDVVQNKLLDRGYSTQLVAYEGLKFTAGTLWYASLIGLFVILFIYMTHDTIARSRIFFFDVLIGSISIASLGVMYATTLLMLHDIQKIPVLDVAFSAIGSYHFAGIAIQILAAAYFTFTQ